MTLMVPAEKGSISVAIAASKRDELTAQVVQALAGSVERLIADMLREDGSMRLERRDDGRVHGSASSSAADRTSKVYFHSNLPVLFPTHSPSCAPSCALPDAIIVARSGGCLGHGVPQDRRSPSRL